MLLRTRRLQPAIIMMTTNIVRVGEINMMRCLAVMALIGMGIGCADEGPTGAVVATPSIETTAEIPAANAFQAKALESAKKAVIAQEGWARNGWPKDAKAWLEESPPFGNHRRWMVTVFAPPGDVEKGQRHLRLLVDDTGKVWHYASAWMKCLLDCVAVRLGTGGTLAVSVRSSQLHSAA